MCIIKCDSLNFYDMFNCVEMNIIRILRVRIRCWKILLNEIGIHVYHNIFSMDYRVDCISIEESVRNMLYLDV